MERRTFIAGIAGGGIAAASAAPALAQGQRRLALVTDRPEAALRLAARVGAASGGRLALDVAPLPEGAGPLMRAAVAAGEHDAYLGAEAMFAAQEPALALFSAMPAGMSPSEVESWISAADGGQMWDLVNEGAGIRAMLAGDDGPLPLWTREPLDASAGAGGLKGPVATYGAGLRMAEMAGAGAIDISAGGDPSDAFAIEGLSVTRMMASGLHERFPFMTAPGLSFPSSTVALGLSGAAWDSLPEADRFALEVAAAAHNAAERSLAAFENARALVNASGALRVAETPDALWTAGRDAAETLLGEIEATGPAAMDAGGAYRYFLADVAGWSEIGESAYFKGRKRALSASL